MTTEATIQIGKTTLTACIENDDPTVALILIDGKWHDTTTWDGETLRPNIRGGDWVELAFDDLSAALVKAYKE